MSNAKWGIGTILSIAGNPIAALTVIDGPESLLETQDGTAHDSVGGYREYVATLKDVSVMKITGFFYPGDTLGQRVLKTAYDNKTLETFILTAPATMGAYTQTFQGWITAYKPGPWDFSKLVSFSASIRVSGAVTEGYTASAGISVFAGIEETGTAALVLIPTFDEATLVYNADPVNTASEWVKFTATFTGTAKVYDSSMTLLETLTTTVQSGALALGAVNTITEFIIIQSNTGYVDTTYRIRIARPSP